MGCSVPTRSIMAAGSTLIMLGCAGMPSRSSETIGRSPDLISDTQGGDAGDAGVNTKAALSANDLHFDAGTVDPSRLMTSADRDQVTGPGTAGPAGASGLVLHVAERGPSQPWIIAVSNEGSTSGVLTADTRLLWFEVNVAGSKKSVRCRLPEDLLPKDSEPRLLVTLTPGESVAQLIDPRLYCFSSGDQKQLVPGARVTPHLGWPELPNRTAWEKGRKVASAVPQPPPFVAHRADLDVEMAVAARSTALKVAKSVRLRKGVARPSDASLGVPLPMGVDKQLVGPELTLRDTYAEWSSSKSKSPGSDAPESPLELRLVQGSDARTEYNATVQLTLHNRSKRKMLLYFRREFVTFEVIGPAGIQTCSPSPDDRSPDRNAFVSLGPGASRSFSSRLSELCPRDTFDMPGLYLVNGQYDATETGFEWNLSAFTGSITSSRPANVRIRIGELSILQKVILRKPSDNNTEASAIAPHVDAGK